MKASQGPWAFPSEAKVELDPMRSNRDFRAGILGSAVLLLGAFAFVTVIESYASWHDAFMRGEIPGLFPYFSLAFCAFYALLARDLRVLRLVLVGLWLSAAALALYALLRLLGGALDVFGVSLLLALAFLPASVISLGKWKAIQAQPRVGVV